MTELIKPHGGKLIDLLASPERAATLKAESINLPSWHLTARQLCDLELLMSGGFSPLTGFMKKDDYEGVLNNMRLADGTLWPMPITLDVDEAFAKNIGNGDRIVLRSPEGVPLATLTVEDKWTPNKEQEAMSVFGTADTHHAGVAYLFNQAHNVYLGGTIEGIERPHHHTYQHLRHTPAELREELTKRNWTRTVAFQTRNPLHKAHYELTVRAAKQSEANFLLHPVVGMTKPGDVNHYIRVRCYQQLLKHYPESTTMISLLPLAMRMGGPREALWHAIIRKNHGATHFIVGRDHAGPGKNAQGEPFYDAYAAQELVKKHEEELGVTLVPFQEMVFVEDKAQYMPRSEVPDGSTTLSISGTEFRRRLKEGLDIPDWFSFPEIIQELRQAFPEKSKQGFTVFFTGLSGAGKSTIANILMEKLLEEDHRPVTLLDGDIVRKHLSSELGFSKEHRDINIKRIGFVASEITKNRGVAICAPIAPYDNTRKDVRSMIEQYGGFILVHIATPLTVCEERDRKGLYAKARKGIIQEFTGISDPYEAPRDADVVIDTTDITPEQAAQEILLHLEKEGFIK